MAVRERDGGDEPLEAFRPMSYACPRCGVRLVDDAEDPACDYELEGAQERHTVKRCAEVVVDSTKPLRPREG